MISLVAAIALLAASVASGEAQIGLFLIFPFIIAWGPMAVAGVVMLLLAMLCAFLAIWSANGTALGQADGSEGAEAMSAPRTERKFGGVVMIGPIPIAFGSDKKTAKTMMLLGIALFVVLLLVFLFLVHPFI